jgi:hypothetical protein
MSNVLTLEILYGPVDGESRRNHSVVAHRPVANSNTVIQ